MDYLFASPSNPTTKYLSVAPDGAVTSHEGALTVGTLQALVGGDFESLPSPNPKVLVFAHENGKREGFEYNWVATRFCRPVLHPNDMVVGTVVVTGGPDSDGNPTDVDSDVEALLREAKR